MYFDSFYCSKTTLFYLSFPIIAYKIDCDRDNIRLNNKAVKKVSTVKPPTILVQIKIITALITNKNKPKVKTVSGNVSITNIGFINKLSKPKTIATSKAVRKFGT